MIGKQLGVYQITAQVGAGAMSEVYRAHDSRLQRDVALKLLPANLAADPERRRRFENEARILASLHHPGIVTVHSVEECEGLHFMTMEMVEGHSLANLLAPPGLDVTQFVALAGQIAAALGAAHERGVTHRDLKPANIMVNDRGQVKILDFGLAKAPAPLPASTPDSTPGESTLDGIVLGTFPYMAPEQLEGKPADPRSDLFSLGVVLYEMGTGQRPFSGETPARLISAILRDTPPLISSQRTDFPRSLALLVQQCLEKDPALRPASAGALCTQLATLGTPAAGRTFRGGPSIAVLPFLDLSPDKDQGYFCEGIAEELISSLAKLRELCVASRTSSFKFRGSEMDIRDIGRQLGVGTVLEGSVRKAGARLRIDAQLISVEDGYHLWSGQYDRELQDVFAIQDEIARSIVRSLRLTLSPSEAGSLHAPPTIDAQAFDYYLRGRKAYYEFRRRGIEVAQRMFAFAIKHDPHYARAFAGMADCCCFLYLYAERSALSLREADAASRKALELDSELAEAHASRGLVLSLKGDHAAAEAAFEAAIRLGPQLFEAYYLYARDCFARGELQKAAQLFEKAYEIRPEDYQSPLLVAQIYIALGRPADAEGARRRGVRIAEEAIQANPADVRALYMGANGLVGMGDMERGLEWAALALAIDPDEPMVLYNVACINALAGLLDEAIDCLERAVRAGLRQKGWFDHDSDLDPLRGTPRFAALMERLERGDWS